MLVKKYCKRFEQIFRKVSLLFSNFYASVNRPIGKVAVDFLFQSGYTVDIIESEGVP